MRSFKTVVEAAAIVGDLSIDDWILGRWSRKVVGLSAVTIRIIKQRVVTSMEIAGRYGVALSRCDKGPSFPVRANSAVCNASKQLCMDVSRLSLA